MGSEVMKKIIQKIFSPNRILGFLLFNFSMGLLIYVFACHLENTPPAYIAYFMSTYALFLFCIWFYKACKFSNSFIKENSRIYKIYQEHREEILKLSLFWSFLFNLVYGIFKMIGGIYYKSIWLITFAVYYLLLCFMKASLVHGIKREEFGSNLKREYRKLKHTGFILLLLDFILIGMILLIIWQNQEISYPAYFIYLVAIYDFYLIISAFVNVLKYRREKSPILVASKCIHLTVAMVSIISLEVSMIYEFGGNDMSFKRIMTSCTGFFVCVINSFMAIHMIVEARKKSFLLGDRKLDSEKL